MHVQAQNVTRTRKLGFVCLPFLVAAAIAGFTLISRAQDSVRPPDDRIRAAQEFLRVVYPQLTDKGSTLTVETAFQFDDLANKPTFLIIDVGAGPKYATLGCCVGGVMGGSLPIQRPSLSGKDSAPLVTTQESSTKLTLPTNEESDSQGRIHPKQYLQTRFTFDLRDHVTEFTAEGPAITDTDADREFSQFVDQHPGISQTEIVAKLKQSGVKYGPNDLAQFTRDVPLRKLEPFVGKLELLAVGFSQLDEKRSNIDTWPFWTVRAAATRQDGSIVEYQIIFERRKGALVSLRLAGPKPNRPT
jgi:hypothetical protein